MKDRLTKSVKDGIFNHRLPISVHTALKGESVDARSEMSKIAEGVIDKILSGELDVPKEEKTQASQSVIPPEKLQRFLALADERGETANGLFRRALEMTLQERIANLKHKHRHSNSPRPDMPPTKNVA